MLAVIGGLFWLFLWLTGWWFAAVVPAAFFVWMWWLGGPAMNGLIAAVLIAPWVLKLLLTYAREQHDAPAA